MTKVEKFTEQYFNEVLLETTNLIKTKINMKSEDIISELRKIFEKYFLELSLLQKESVPVKVGFIHISFLLTSLYEEEIKLRIEAHTKTSVIGGESIYTQDIAIPSLKEFVENAKKRFETLAEKDNVSAFIHPVYIVQLTLRMMIAMNRYLYEYYKYQYREIFINTGIENVLKEDELYITYGEYFDWQKPIFAIKPEIDIFNRDEDADLNFREFNDFIYNEKLFSELIIKNSVFKNCTFDNSKLEGCTFIDCIFDSCLFNKCTFEKFTILGATFIECNFDDVCFDEIAFEESNELLDSLILTKECEFLGCKMQNCKINQSDFSSSKLYECNVINISVNNSKVDDSDFEIFVPEE